MNTKTKERLQGMTALGRAVERYRQLVHMIEKNHDSIIRWLSADVILPARSLSMSQNIKRMLDNRLGIVRGPEDCPLCQLYWRNDCVRCPVYRHTGQCYCCGTPYDDLETCLSAADTPEECYRDYHDAYEDELKFLQGLQHPSYHT